MFFESMQYTMGTAIERAREHGHPVELLVEGQWLSGRVVATDGVGVVLEGDDEAHAVVRTDRISAVRVHSEVGMRPRINQVPPQRADADFDGAMPMPGPRAASETGADARPSPEHV